MKRGIRLSVVIAAVAACLLAAGVTRGIVGFVDHPWSGLPLLPDGSLGPVNLIPDRIRPHLGDVRFGDRVVAVDGERDGSAGSVRRAVEHAGSGGVVSYVLRARDGMERAVRVPVTTFTFDDFRGTCLPFLVGGFLGLLLGALPVLAHPGRTDARLFFLFNLGLAVNFGFLMPDAYYLHRWPRWGFAGAGLAVGTLLHLALSTPGRLAAFGRRPRPVLALVYGWALVVTVLLGARGVRAVALLVGSLALGFLGLSLNAALTLAGHDDAHRRQQARILLPGFVLALGSGLLLTARQVGLVAWSLPVAAHLVPLWVLGVLITYAMLRSNLFELDAVVRRGLTLTILAAGALGAYAVAFVVARMFVPEAEAWAAAGAVAVLALTLVPAVGTLRRGVEAGIERLLFPRQRAARDAMYAASRELARPRSEDELAGLLRDTARGAVASSTLRLLTGKPDGPLVELGAEAGPLSLPPSDPLHPLFLRGISVSFEVGALGPRRTPPRAAARRAAELGVRLLVALPHADARKGGLLLGPRTDGRLYTRDDESLLSALAAQAAVALESAAAWDEVRRLEQRLNAENLYLREEVQLTNDPTGIVGKSPGLRALLAQVQQVAPTDATVLIHGETGTGKELVVRALHDASRRRDRMLVKVACAAVPETLLESEFFGYERGAFTGATGRKAGRFELADGGTLFLDDVDTLPIGVQAKLLRVLQEGEVQRLGSNQTRKVDVRVVAATNRDLLAEVQAGRFREDLYYRLNVVPLGIPPLRERLEDLPLLVEHFIAQDGPRLGRTDVRSVSSEALEAMRAYAWPGNVRELRNVVHRALVLSHGEVLRLPGPLEAAAPVGDDPGTGSLAEQVRELKIRLIRGALAAAGGNQRVAAERLGLHRQSLTRMIRDLEPGRRRAPHGGSPPLRVE